jgi:hypothetical protein
MAKKKQYKQRSTKHTHTTKDPVTRTPLKTLFNLLLQLGFFHLVGMFIFPIDSNTTFIFILVDLKILLLHKRTVRDLRQVGVLLQVSLPITQPPRYTWNIVENGAKHHKPNSTVNALEMSMTKKKLGDMKRIWS